MTNVILVDEQDKTVGLLDKMQAHLGSGVLHRAFTILVFNKNGETLIAKRSANKMLWPDIWDNTCASHPLENENNVAAGQRRLREELGFSCRLQEVDKFTYHAKYGEIGSENEVCAVLIGNYDGKVVPDKNEVSDYKWIRIDDLKNEMSHRPDDYSIWFRIALDRLIDKGVIAVKHS